MRTSWFDIDKWWYQAHPLRWFLWPLAKVFQCLSYIRRCFLLFFAAKQIAVPIIVVGNLTVGGTGKTPLVIALAKAIQAKGWRVGIVSRGYGGTCFKGPHEVLLSDAASLVGDEPLLLLRKTGCPVVIAKRRMAAVHYLLKRYQPHVILSDDGLQHYAMKRDLEIIVIDGARELGNRLCLPAGPLRESPKRLKKADFIVVNGGNRADSYPMHFVPGKLVNLLTKEEIDPKMLSLPVAAVAGIGTPQRFFATLQTLGLSFKKYPFPDHHAFQLSELQFAEKIIVMTEKDAVKCLSFASKDWYFLPIEATLSNSFWQAFWSHTTFTSLGLK